MVKKFETQRTGTSQVSIGAFRAAKWRAQNFTVRETHVITSVNLYLHRVLSPGTITVSIKAVDGTNRPTGADLCSATLAGTSVTNDTGGDIYNFDFGAGTTLIVNTKYALVCRTDTGDASNYISWWIAGSVYSYGNAIESEDSGSVWTHNTSNDFWFSENGYLLADPILYDSYDGSGTAYALTLNAATKWAFQSFTPYFSFDLEEVHIFFGKGVGDTVGTIYLDVYLADGAGEPTGAALASQTVDDTVIGESPYAWVPFVFSSPASLTAGVKYCIVIHGPSLDTSNVIVWPFDDDGLGNSAFEGGDQGYSTTSGVSWSIDTTQDQKFRCYGTSTSENAPGLYGFGVRGTLSKWNGTDAWELIVPKLGTNSAIVSAIMHDSKIYVGTNTGNLLVWSSANSWILAASAPVAPVVGAINGLEVYNDKLYGHAGAYLLEWDGFGDWIFRSPNTAVIGHLKSFNGKLYACGNDTGEGRLFEWNDVDDWVVVAPTYTSYERVITLEVFDGKLYGGCGGTLGAGLLEWNGTDAWVLVAPKFDNQLEIWSMAVYNNELFGGTYNTAQLHKWNGIDAWVEAAPRPGTENYVYSLAEYNNNLYGGSAGGGLLLQWNDADAWVTVAPVNDGQTSISALVAFNLAPVITDESTSTTSDAGAEVPLYVTAEGIGLTYVWYLNGSPISGETSSTILVYPTVTGTYKCIVTNAGGSVSTGDMVITVKPNPYRYNPYNVPLDSERIT